MRFLMLYLIGNFCLGGLAHAQNIPSFLGGVLNSPLGKSSAKAGFSIARSDRSAIPASVMGIMNDGSVSWSQPEDSELYGYNGRCGEVAAANVLSMIHERISPNRVARKMRDFFPGTSPTTLVDFINSESAGEWKLGVSNPEQAKQHIHYMLNKGAYKNQNDISPFITLISENGTSLHWVTVVNFIANNFVVYNDNGKQSTKNISSFLQMWGFQNMSLSRKLAIQQVCCQPYTVIFQN